MLHVLYLLCIAPLEFLMRLALEWGYSLNHSWGWSLVLLSLLVNTLVLPIYNRAESWQEEERELKRRMARNEAMFRRRCKGWERFVMLSTLRRLHGYDWRLILRASVGLLLQIPVFFAAFHLLSHYTALNGQRLGPLADLGAPDALLSLGGFGVNVLPIAMTAVNLFSAFFYTRDLTRRDKAQIYGMAAIFLVLLYNAASALTLYWTLNNVYSLCKNIVEKDWMRRPGWRKCWMNRQNNTAGPFAGTIAHLWTRLLNAARYSFGTGSVLWLYTCTVAFARHDNLANEGLSSAFRHFGGQCIVTASLASLALTILIPAFRFQRRPVWESIFYMVSVATLFLLQLQAVFNVGFEVREGRFLFDMWNGTGCLCFALWASGIFWLGRVRDRLARRFASLSGSLLTWFDVSKAGANGGSRAEPAEAAVPSSRDTCMFACLMGTVCGCFLWYFIPFSTYLPNANEFEFNGWELLWQVTPWCLLTSMVSIPLFFIATRFLPCEHVTLPWRRKSGTYGRVSIVSSIVLTTLFVLWIESTILSYGLPQLNGETNLFNSTPRMIVDSIILIDLLFIGIICWRFIARKFNVFLSLFVILSLTSLFDIYSVSEEKVDTRKFNAMKELKFVSRNMLYSQLHFSDNHNIIILLVDSLDTPTFEKTIERYSELKDIFEGFWVFRENLGPGGFTRIAIPQILLGEVYEGENYSKLVQDALVGMDSIAANAVKHGYDVFIDSAFWFVRSGKEKYDENIYEKQQIQLDEVMPLFIFRFLPYYGKSLLENFINLKNHDSNVIDGYDKNKRVFNRVLSRVGTTTDKNVLQYLYFFGIHDPLIKENDIETTREFINDFKKFTDVLRENHLYDKSTIIIMADHGRGQDRRFNNPVFMLKTPFSQGTIKWQDDLMSSHYLKNLLAWLYDYGFENDAVLEFLKTLPKVRTMYKDGLGKMEARGTLDTLSLTISNRKPLQDNIIYTLSPDNVQFPYAYHLATREENTHELLNHNQSVNIDNFKINMSFLYDGQPGTKKMLTLMIDSYHNNGALDIYDRVSGSKTHWENTGQISVPCTVDQRGYINIQFVPLTRQATTLRYVIVSDVSSPAPRLPRYRKEASHWDRMPHF